MKKRNIDEEVGSQFISAKEVLIIKVEGLDKVSRATPTGGKARRMAL